MPGVLMVQNTRAEGSGRLGELLASDGFEIERVCARSEAIPAGGHSLAVILGAPESANDCLPYLRREEELVRRCVADGTPVLGICLGSQLIARALGGRVYRGHAPEIGFYGDLRPRRDSGLFAGFPDPFTVFHWHADTFDLPPGAELLASSGGYENQAFRCGTAVGLQFHLEADEAMARLWIENSRERLEAAPGVDPAGVLSEVPCRMPEVRANMDRFYGNLKSEFSL